MSQQFCLKWNNHSNNMIDAFKSLLSNEAMVDVTLACDGLSLKAHKIVLSACSPFFQSLFLENPCKHPIVILSDIRYTDLKALIDFMYHGKVNVAQEQLSALLKTAETLRVKGLAEVTNDIRQSADEPSRQSSASRSDTPPPKRRKGRMRKQSVSDQRDDEQSTSKDSDSDKEELSTNMDWSTLYNNMPLQSSCSSFFRSQQQEQQLLEQNADTYEPDEKFMRQSLTTHDLQRDSGHSLVHSNMELQGQPQSRTYHSTSSVSVAPSPMSSHALVSSQQLESPPDIKPEVIDVEPIMSPVSGSCHGTDKIIDRTTSGISAAGSYQGSSNLMPTDEQSPDIKPEHLDLEPPVSSVTGPSYSTDESMDQNNLLDMPAAGSYQDSSVLMPADGQSQGEEDSSCRDVVSLWLKEVTAKKSLSSAAKNKSQKEKGESVDERREIAWVQEQPGASSSSAQARRGRKGKTGEECRETARVQEQPGASSSSPQAGRGRKGKRKSGDERRKSARVQEQPAASSSSAQAGRGQIGKRKTGDERRKSARVQEQPGAQAGRVFVEERNLVPGRDDAEKTKNFLKLWHFVTENKPDNNGQKKK